MADKAYHEGENRMTNMEKKSCELQGNIFPNGSVTCMGDQRMQTPFGWQSISKFKSPRRTVSRGPSTISSETFRANGAPAMRFAGAVIRNNMAFIIVLSVFSWMLFIMDPVCARAYSIIAPGTPSGVIFPGGTSSSGYGISDSGHVPGPAYDPTGYKTNAFLYAGDKTTIPRTRGGANSRAYRLNHSGQIAGQADTQGGQHHAFLYSGGKMIDLGTLGGANSSADDINDSGQVVGQADTRGGQHHAFLYNGEKMIDLGTLGGANSRGARINGSGQVVGQADMPGGQHHAFLYKDGKMIDLGTLGGANSSALDINDSGQVVGSSDTSSGQSHAFLYSGEKMIDLGTLGGGTPRSL